MSTIQVIAQCAVVILAFIYFAPRIEIWPVWLLLLAFLLMAMRRVTASLLGGDGRAILDLGTLDKVLIPFTITMLLFIGFLLLVAQKYDRF